MHLSEYALGGAAESRIDWSKPAKGLLMGLICVTFVFVWLGLMEGFLGINYQVWNLSTYLKMSPMRILRAIPYVLIIFTVMFIGNMNQRVLPSTGNARKDMWIAVAVNTVMTAFALFLLLLIQYGGSMLLGTGQTPDPADRCIWNRQEYQLRCSGFCVWILLYDGRHHGCGNLSVPQIRKYLGRSHSGGYVCRSGNPVRIYPDCLTVSFQNTESTL